MSRARLDEVRVHVGDRPAVTEGRTGSPGRTPPGRRFPCPGRRRCRRTARTDPAPMAAAGFGVVLGAAVALAGAGVGFGLGIGVGRAVGFGDGARVARGVGLATAMLPGSSGPGRAAMNRPPATTAATTTRTASGPAMAGEARRAAPADARAGGAAGRNDGATDDGRLLPRGSWRRRPPRLRRLSHRLPLPRGWPCRRTRSR